MATQNSFMFYSNFLDAIDQLPEKERGNACYQFCKYALTGQIPEDKSLSMFCIGVSFSVHKFSGRGGNHNPTGKNQYSKLAQSGQTGQSGQSGQKTIQTQTKIYNNNNNNINNILNNIGNCNDIIINSNFKCSDYDQFVPYIKEMPEEIILSVENWLKKTKLGNKVSVEFVTKQFINFAGRQKKPLFKTKDVL